MKGFKNSSKTEYMKGGSCEAYAKGGSVKGAAKISKVMGEFKSGELHSGSKKGPMVKNPKQAVAIALSEARKAGAKIPMKKNNGGSVEAPDVMIANMTKEELQMGERGMRMAKERLASEKTKALGAKVDRETQIKQQVKKAVPVPRDKPLVPNKYEEGLLGRRSVEAPDQDPRLMRRAKGGPAKQGPKVDNTAPAADTSSRYRLSPMPTLATPVAMQPSMSVGRVGRSIPTAVPGTAVGSGLGGRLRMPFKKGGSSKGKC